jgi:beta-N-acetylhexosaminidase
MLASVLCLFLLSACFGRGNVAEKADEANTPENDKPNVEIDSDLIRATAIASSLDNRLLAAQSLICGIDGKGKLPPHMKLLLTECPAGGVILFRYNLDTRNEEIYNLIEQTASLIRDESGLSPFIAMDHEGGSVNRFMPGTASLPAAISYWEATGEDRREVMEKLQKIEADSFKTGREMKMLGINLNLAPVAEYLTAENRGFLGNRSYGPDRVFTTEAAAAFIRGMERAGVTCVVKHFPGSAGPDPHFSPSVLKGDKAALDELVSPFAALINRGARAVMVAHTSVPAMDVKIASLSNVIMENWLRGELGFKGIIICDDFSMAAASGRSTKESFTTEEAAIQSIAAGADMVLVWPPDIRRTHRALVSALEDGRLSRERLLESTGRVIYEKIKMGLVTEEFYHEPSRTNTNERGKSLPRINTNTTNEHE